jgi:hypothetical protein
MLRVRLVARLFINLANRLALRQAAGDAETAAGRGFARDWIGARIKPIHGDSSLRIGTRDSQAIKPTGGR